MFPIPPAQRDYWHRPVKEIQEQPAVPFAGFAGDTKRHTGHRYFPARLKVQIRQYAPQRNLFAEISERKRHRHCPEWKLGSGQQIFPDLSSNGWALRAAGWQVPQRDPDQDYIPE